MSMTTSAHTTGRTIQLLRCRGALFLRDAATGHGFYLCDVSSAYEEGSFAHAVSWFDGMLRESEFFGTQLTPATSHDATLVAEHTGDTITVFGDGPARGSLDEKMLLFCAPHVIEHYHAALAAAVEAEDVDLVENFAAEHVDPATQLGLQLEIARARAALHERDELERASRRG
jgi:hypothetical protein